MIDTHCHLYAAEFKTDIHDVINNAIKAGVNKFYLPAIDSKSTREMLDLEKIFEGKCFAMIGLHPCSVKKTYIEELSLVEELLNQRKFVGIGETGLDLFWEKSYLKQQEHALELQAELALKYNLPIILHTREAMRETINVIKNFSSQGLKGIFHCFGGTREEAEEITGMGFYLGIGGVITYKNSGLRNVLQVIGLEYMVLETDAPYLSPEPFRGKRNESGHLPLIAKKLAEIKNTSMEEVVSVTTRNAEKIFSNNF